MSGRLARHWYGALLRAFPADLRRTFGPEMLRVLEEERAVASARGRVALVRCHLEATADLLAALVRERVVSGVHAAGWMLLAAAVLNVGYDLMNPKLSMGWSAWAMTLAALASGFLLSKFEPPSRRRT